MTSNLDEAPRLAFIAAQVPPGYPQSSFGNRAGDEGQVVRRKRRRTSPHELSILESEFRNCPKPCKQVREEIASRVGMTEKNVQVWFQNKRQSCRRQRGGIYEHQENVEPRRIPSKSFSAAAAKSGSFLLFSDMKPPVHSAHAVLPPGAGSHAHSHAHAHTHKGPGGDAGSARASASSGRSTPVTSAAGTPNSSFGSIRTPFKSPAPGENGGCALLPAVAVRSKSFRLTTSADGRAQLVARSPLKALDSNVQGAPAKRFASLPSPRELQRREFECVNDLLSLKSGDWR